MVGLVVVVLVLLVVGVALLGRPVRVVPIARAGIVERRGRYHRTLEPGVRALVPYLDRVRALVELREQELRVGPTPVVAREGQVVTIQAVLHLQVTDPVAATYETEDHVQAVGRFAVTVLRTIGGRTDEERLLSAHHLLAVELRDAINDYSSWGVRVLRAEVTSITRGAPPHPTPLKSPESKES